MYKQVYKLTCIRKLDITCNVTTKTTELALKTKHL